MGAFGSASARLIASTPVRAPCGHDQPELPTKAAQRVDPGGARPHPARANPVQALQCLLLDGFHPHLHDVGAACRFEQRTGIGGIGLVAFHVGPDVGGRQ